MKELQEVDYDPICPYCNEPIDHFCLHPRKGRTLFGKSVPVAGISGVSCPHCRKLLGAPNLAFHQYIKKG